MTAGPSRARSGPGVIYEDGPQGGFGGAAPKKFFMTTPLSLPENEENAFLIILVILIILRNCQKIPCSIQTIQKALQQIVFMNQEHRFMLVMLCSHQFVLRGNERLKGRKD